MNCTVRLSKLPHNKVSVEMNLWNYLILINPIISNCWNYIIFIYICTYIIYSIINDFSTILYNMETGKNILLHFKRLCIKRLILCTRLDKVPIVNRRSLFEGEKINIISQRSFPLREETTPFLRYVCKSRMIPLAYLHKQTDLQKKNIFPRFV